MKRKIILFVFILIGCTYGTRPDWDSGARADRDEQQQRMEEMSENMGNQYPTESPSTERSQPF